MLTLKEKPRDIEKEYQDILEKIKKGDTSTIEIDAELFTRLRIGIVTEEIPHESIALACDEGVVPFTEDGFLDSSTNKCFSNWFCLTQKFLRSRIDFIRRREERQKS